jgi:hypothetical protein
VHYRAAGVVQPFTGYFVSYTRGKELLMGSLKDIFSIQTHHGKTIEMNGYAVTPHSQTLVLGRVPGRLIWNRPLAVVVEHNGAITRTPILDVTRWIQIGLFCTGLLVSILGMIFIQERKEKTR